MLRHVTALALVALVVILVVVVVVRCPTSPALAAAGAAEAMDLAATGRLPVRFNGRVTTWDAVARAYLLRLSGGDAYADDDGGEQRALRWMLDVGTGVERGWQAKVVPVGEPTLQALLSLPHRPSPASRAN